MSFALLLFVPPAVALLALGAAWQRRLHRFRVHAWMAQNAVDRGLQGALMLHVAGDPAWSRIEELRVREVSS